MAEEKNPFDAWEPVSRAANPFDAWEPVLRQLPDRERNVVRSVTDFFARKPRQLATGVAKAALAAPEIPQDLMWLLASGQNQLRRLSDPDPEAYKDRQRKIDEEFEALASSSYNPASYTRGFRQELSEGYLPRPKDPIDVGLQTAGEFLGPGLAGKAAALAKGGRAARELIPALKSAGWGAAGSEAAGLASEAFGLDPAQEAVARALSGGIAPAISVPRAVRRTGELPFAEMRRAAPTPEALRAERNRLYTEADRNAVEVPGNRILDLARNIRKEWTAGNYNPDRIAPAEKAVRKMEREVTTRQKLLDKAVEAAENRAVRMNAHATRAENAGWKTAPKIRAKANDLYADYDAAKNAARAGPSVSTDILEQRRQTLSRASVHPEPSTGAAAGIAVRELDKFLDPLPSTPIYRAARETAVREMLDRKIGKLVEKKIPTSQIGEEQGGRAAAAAALTRFGERLPPQVNELLRRAVSREGPMEAIRVHWPGQLLRRATVPVATAVGSVMGGPIGAIAGLEVGGKLTERLRRAGAAKTRKQIEAARSTLRAGEPAYRRAEALKRQRQERLRTILRNERIAGGVLGALLDREEEYGGPR
jgi:hypothetical protein